MVEYQGEHLVPGYVGHILVIIAFAGSVLTFLAFLFATRQQHTPSAPSWRRIGRSAWLVHTVAIVGVIAVLYFLIFNHYYEYDYVRRTSADSTPLKYLVSSLWAQQQGSFLLWLVWHAVMGCIILLTIRSRWQAPVMAVFGFVQLMILTMILGVFVGDYQVGVSPFTLSRLEFPESPVFLLPDYLSRISGTGLNPLLQNYWMIIHPPTLFLGFASTLVPFAFVVAGLWLREYAGWWKPALPFTVFSVAILGTGIMMGGAWAYEALSFGGFWAWDPVENASFLPWLTLLAGLHTMIVFKSTKRAMRLTMIFFICTMFLVLYSTFLTRSGILGDTSVHAFTDLGMSGQLLLLMGAIIVPAIVMLGAAWKQLPKAPTEEHILSREFWMFIGAIILGISALHIAVSTSLPVINAIFGTQLASPEDAVSYYNSVQIWIGILIALLSGCGLFLKFKKTPLRALNQLLIHAGIALAATVLIALAIRVDQASYYILLFSGLFGSSANMHIVIRNLLKKFKLSGAAISHLGFGLVMVALIVALANSSVISKNVSGLAYSPDRADSSFNRYNVRMNIGETVAMGDYRISYLGREQDGPNFYYRILYERFNDNGEVSETFELRPHLLNDPNMGIVANPATKRYLHRDIFTHVSSVPRNSLERDVKQPRMESHTIMEDDSFWTSSGLVVFEGFTPLYDGEDFTVIANLKLHRLHDTISLRPAYSIRDGRSMFSEAKYEPQELTIALTAIEPGKGFTFRTFEVEDWVIMKAIVFPFINLLWFGIVLTITGMLVVLRKRILEFRRQARGMRARDEGRPPGVEDPGVSR